MRTLAISLLLFLTGCDASTDQSGSVDPKWPYSNGDTYTIQEKDDVRGGLLISYVVTGDTLIDGVKWQKHESHPSFKVTSGSSPEPLPVELTLCRIEGNLLFLSLWGDRLVLDLSGASSPVSTSFLTAARMANVPTITPAGTFSSSLYSVSGAKAVGELSLAPDVGLVEFGSYDVGTWRLHSAKIGGRGYP